MANAASFTAKKQNPRAESMTTSVTQIHIRAPTDTEKTNNTIIIIIKLNKLIDQQAPNPRIISATVIKNQPVQ